MSTTQAEVFRALVVLPANERFKRRAGAWLWGSVMVATVIHFAVIRYFPAFRAADLSFGVHEIEAIDLPLEIDVPPPPEAIQRPAVPVVTQRPVYEDVTIAPTTFEHNPVENLPPPPAAAAVRLEDAPVFTPFTVAPRIRDRERARQIVREKYPRMLQDAGIGGTVVVWALIDEEGTVQKCLLHTTCGNSMLDQAALSAVMEIAFVPALSNDRHVPVWVSLPITFAVMSATKRSG